MKNKGFVISTLLAMILFVNACSSTDTDSVNEQEELQTEETENEVELDQEQEEGEQIVEEIQDNEELPKVVALEDEDLITIGEKLLEQVETVYIIETEDEYNSLIEDTFVDVEFYGETVKVSFKPGKYTDVKTIQEEKDVERINENTFMYKTNAKTIVTHSNGEEEVLSERPILLEILYLEDEDTFKILVVR